MFEVEQEAIVFLLYVSIHFFCVAEVTPTGVLAHVVKSREEFEWLIEHVTHEAFLVRDHWEFWTALNESFDKHLVELNQTPTFGN